MGCNRDEGCQTIANNYANSKGAINSSLSSMSSHISQISSKINRFDIPNDYIGSLAKAKISSIAADLNSEASLVNSLSGQISSFADSKQKEHQQHYDDWYASQEDDDTEGGDT